MDSSLEVYPGDPPVEIAVVADPRRGDPARVSRLRISTHAGTHMDAPRHLSPDGAGVDRLALEAMIGPALVVRPSGPRVDAGVVRSLPDGSPPRLLFAGGGALDAEAARELARRKVLLVGTDSLSVDEVGDDRLPVHRILLEAGIIVLESLDLSGVEPGSYRLIALPLRIPGADGAPARAVLAAMDTAKEDQSPDSSRK